MAMDQNDLETLLGIIKNRGVEVIAANGITEESDQFKYLWIKGIYDDIIEYIKTQY